MNGDLELLAHYVAIGSESWNVSTESAWCEYELRVWVEAHLPSTRPLAVCNVGIGVGLWDDWLGYLLEQGITSVDRDERCCRLLKQRQVREQHPHPSEVVCGDVLDGVLVGRAFHVITAVGSTLAENGTRAREVEAALVAALAPDGVLLIGESVAVGEPTSSAADVRVFRRFQLALRTITR